MQWEFRSRVVDVAVNEPYYIFAITEDGSFYSLPFTGAGGVYPMEQDTVSGNKILAMSIDRSKNYVIQVAWYMEAQT